MIRKLYELLNLNIYIILPLIVVLMFNFLECFFKIKLLDIHTFSDNSLNISLSLLGVLLTLLGLFAALPPSKYEKSMKQYGYYRIVYNTLLLGIFAAILHLLLFMANIFQNLQVYLFLIYMTETLIASFWIHRILRLIHRM